MKKEIIVWQKYENVFEKMEEKLYGEDKESLNDMDSDFEDDFDDDEGFDDGYGPEGMKPPGGKTPFIFTGDNAAIPVSEYFPSGKIYNFWIGYSRTPITDEIVDLIDNTDGVETFERFTRYRMRVSVAKLFKPSEVLPVIGKKIKGHINKNEQQ